MTSKPLDAKAEQSQRVLQILGGGPTKPQPKEKKPKNLESKIRAVKAIAEAFGFSDSDIEILLKENNYDQTVVINNILDGITPRPGDSWSVVHNKMTKEEREAKKQTSSSQPTQSKGRGRGGRGGSRGDSDGSGRGGRGGSRGGEGGRGGKREGKDNTRGGANGVGGRGGRGGRSQAGSENGHASSASAPAPVAASSASGQAQPVPTPTQTIVPSGIITSTPNNPAPTIAQIVAGTATVGGAPRPQAQPSQPTQPAPARAAKSPKAGKQEGQQTKTATSPTPSTSATTQQPQPAAAQPSPVQAAQQPSQPAQPAATPQPLVEESTSAAAQAVSSVAPQKSPTQQPQTQPQQSTTAQPQQKSPQQPTYSRQPGYQSNGKPAPRQSQQWKPKPTKETSVVEQFASATAGVAGLHLGPVVLPGEFPSDIDDNSLNFQFGNFHSDTGKPLEPPTETRAEHTQPTPQPQQVQPQQPAVQHLPTPSTSHSHTAAPASSTSSHPHTHHVPHTHTTKQHDQKSGSYQGKQPHHQQPVSHHVQQTHGLGAVINQDPQDAHQLHAMHHMTGMDEMSQMYWQPPVLPYPMSPFPHFETDTSAYYDTYQQAGTYHRQQGGSSDVKYPAVGNAALSGNYRGDGKFSGQEGAAQSGAGASNPGQVAGGTPGSPQQPGTQPHAFPMQGSFPTMYPYHFMGQFPSYQPATSPQYPYRMPLFKTSPPYNFNAVNTPGGYPTSSTAGASGYPEDLANAQDFKGNMYATPYYPVGGLQPDTFMMKQGSGAPSAPASSSTAGKAQQQQQHSLPGVVNQDLNSGATKGQQDYAKFRDVYGGAGAGYYPPGPSRSNQGGY